MAGNLGYFRPWLSLMFYMFKKIVSLLFISQFTKQHNCKITFFPSHCVFQDLSTERRIGSGMREKACTIWMTVSPTGFVVGQSDHVLLWHWRLSHPSVQKFLSVVRVESFIFILGCESYELGKHHHATYHSGVNNRSSSTFVLVHSDIWDTSHVPSVKGFRYFFHFCWWLLSHDLNIFTKS